MLLRKLVVVMGLIAPIAQAGTVSGKFTTTSNNVVPNGTLAFTLTQAAVIAGTASVVTSPVNCWTDSQGNIVGLPGNGAIAAPGLTASGGPVLPSGTYFVRYTWANASGESEPSAERSIFLPSAATLVVTAPVNVPATATAMKVYVGTVAGGETLQGSVTVTSGVLAGNYSQTTTLVAGAALPVTNTSTCSLRFNDELQPSFTGYNVDMVNVNGQRIPGFPQKWYLAGGTLGVVNVANGTPLYSGFVQYPQAVVSNPTSNGLQSINGPLNMNGYPILNTATSVSSAGLALPGSTSGFTTIQAQPVASGTLVLPTGGALLTDLSTNTVSNKTIAASGLPVAGATSGTTTIVASPVASGTLTLPAATDTLTGRTTTDTLINKTYDTAGAGNVLKIAGNQVNAVTGSGATVVLASSPTLTTPSIGAASGNTVTFTNQGAPANPAAGQIVVYGDSGTGILTCRNSSGTSCLSATAAAPLVSGSTNPAVSGVVRVASGDTAVAFRNTANTADINGMSKSAGDVVQVGGTAGISSSGPINAGSNGISGGALTATSVAVGGDTAQTSGAHFAIFYGFQPGTIFLGNLALQTLTKGVTVETISADSTIAANCTTAPTLRVRNIASTIIGPTLPLTTGTNIWSLAGQAVNYPAGDILFLEVNSTGSCATAPANLVVNVSGRMQ